MHYWRPGMSSAQYALLFEDYIKDFEGYSVAEIERACAEHRKNPANKYFPRSGELLEIMGRIVIKTPTIERHATPFRGYPALTEPRATKSVADVLRENGHFAAAEAWRKK